MAQMIAILFVLAFPLALLLRQGDRGGETHVIVE